ncbi:acetate kinase [Oscillatoria salina]|uniref:acetate kinase n=1 Tax=Oscillatoria salina TaxID=331517 RepID=UPI001CC9E8EB|nr:acetate kinase [Oscillatoria salina]MBZ8182299.1 acetate kinase [Oscillatoria salina IIICB1]
MKILVLNAGSSSQKSCLYELEKKLPDSPLKPLWEAKIDWTKKSGFAVLKVENNREKSLEKELPGTEKEKAIAQMLDTLYQGETAVLSSLQEIDVVGHRVVHGGSRYRKATIVTPEVQATIKSLFPLAPEHNPINLEGIEAVEKVLPNVRQIVVFDTAFHAEIPLAAAVYPLPYEFFQQGIRRYGFHGISHQYCLQRTAQLLGKEAKYLSIITCHLGNGCSLAAIRDGVCVNTTMGYTPLEGLMMGSRSGSIDPGILIQLMRSGYNAEKLNRLLNKESGLKGLSGISGDVRQVSEAVKNGDEQAKLAFDVYLHRLQFYLGAMLSSLGRLDALVFTGGVGENKPEVRQAGCEGLSFLGVKLDSEKNQTSPKDTDIATADSPVKVLVINTQEDWAIAQECWHLCQD